MDPQEARQDWLPPYARDLVATAIEQSGFPLLIAQVPGEEYDDQLTLAHRGNPHHTLIYASSAREHLLHFIVNACYKIRRIYDAPPADRLVPVTEVDTKLPPADERELRCRNPMIPRDAIPELSSFVQQGLLRQVVSMPLDIRVERDIAATLPEHTAVQNRYLLRQVEDLEPHFRPTSRRFMPPRVYAAASAMNLVLADETAVLTGVPLPSWIRDSPERPLADSLRRELVSVATPGHPGDRELIDRWAEAIALRGCFEWVPLSSVG